MSDRNTGSRAALLRIYLGDFDKYHHHPLYSLIVQQAQEFGLAGCTVFRGFWGYGVRRLIHTDIALETAGERPVLIEIVDTQEKVREFALKVSPMLEKSGGLITEETVEIHRYEASPKAEPVLDDESVLMRAYFRESDQYERKPLFEAVVERCKQQGIAGCTVIQGLMGFGESNLIHRDRFFAASPDLPIVLEIVDSAPKIRKLLERITPLLRGALVIEERVKIHHFPMPRSLAAG